MRRKGDESRENVSGQYCKPYTVSARHTLLYIVLLETGAIILELSKNRVMRMCIRTRENHHTWDELFRRARWKIKELCVHNNVFHSTVSLTNVQLYTSVYVSVVNWKKRIRFWRQNYSGCIIYTWNQNAQYLPI